MPVHRILIVDDDRDNHELLKPILSGRDWDVESVFDGMTALERLQAEAFEVVLASLHMPGMDGFELLRRTRILRPGTKVILLNSGWAAAEVVRAIQERAFSYYTKPLSASTLADMVCEALNTQAWEDDIEVLSADPHWITLEVRCKLETVDRLVQFLREIKADVPADKREDATAALRELLLNAVEHGGRSNPQERVRVSYVRTSRAIICHINDPGPGFSLDAASHAAIANPPDEPIRHVEIRAERGVRPGGFGILLTRNLVDELVYNEKGNEVLFVKYLDRPAGKIGWGTQTAGPPGRVEQI